MNLNSSSPETLAGSSMSRRQFLQTTGTTTALGLVTAPLVASRTVLGANERLGVGFIRSSRSVSRS